MENQRIDVQDQRKYKFERKIFSLSRFISRHMEKFFILNVDAFVPKDKITPFKHFTYALYATEAMFEQANRPLGRFEQVKNWFSAMHQNCGYKTEISVNDNGLAMMVSGHIPGIVSHIQIFKER